MKKIAVLLIVGLSTVMFLNAQEKAEHESEKGNKGFHQFSFMLSHSKIGEGIVNGSKKSISAPSLGLDYNYWISNKLGLGLQTDIITESFKIEDNGGAILDRSTPLAIVPSLTFKPKKHSLFIVGLGKEYAKEGNFTLSRFGYEYSFELPKEFELSFGVTYDKKWDAYDIWTFGIIVSKLFK